MVFFVNHYVDVQKNVGATAFRAWLRVETFNGLQEVLRFVYIPGPKTIRTYLVSDQELLMKELRRKKTLRKLKKKDFRQEHEGVALHDEVKDGKPEPHMR